MVKVILLQNVPRVGQKFDVKDVAAGYATNFLYPNRLAELATPAKEAQLAKKRDEIDAARARHVGALSAAVSSLDGTTITIKAKADNKDHLFKKLRTEDIAGALPKIGDKAFPAEAIALDAPIKTLGEHSIEVAGGDAKATFTLHIEKE